MSLPWHISLENAPCFRDKKNTPQPSLQKHYCNLKLNDNPCEEVQTGIMCDIGTGNREPATIQRLIGAGMTIARLNLKDMEPEACNQLVQAVRQAVYNYSTELDYVYPLAIAVDVEGPDIETGNLKSLENVELVEGNTVRLTNDTSWKDSGTSDCLFVGYDHLTELNTGDFIYIESLSAERIKLVIIVVGDDTVECKIAKGGILGNKMTVKIAQAPKNVAVKDPSVADTESLNCESNQDFHHIGDQIKWAVNSDVDAFLVPNAQTINDIKDVKMFINDNGKHILVFACIDSSLGFDNIDQILTEADGIYLDRSLLSIDIPVEKICIAQKILMAKCNMAGKPCICKVVINEKIPTLCVSDIVNLVVDGADNIFLELQYDSPINKLKPDSVRMAEYCIAAAVVISRHAERIMWHPRTYGNIELMQSPLEDPTKVLAIAAVELAMRSQAVVIISLTNSGRTAKILSYAKPPCPIIAVTRSCTTARQLRFWRNVRAMHYFEIGKGSWMAEVEARVAAALSYCKAKRVVHAGDPYVLITGSRRGVGYCDAVRLLYASVKDTVIVDD